MRTETMARNLGGIRGAAPGDTRLARRMASGLTALGLVFLASPQFAWAQTLSELSVAAQTNSKSFAKPGAFTGDLVSSGGTVLSSNVNNFLGANRFYDAGYTGSRATAAVIEAGLAWSGHETLGHISQNIVGTGALGQFDRHATWVSHALAGRSTVGGDTTLQRGIAHGANLWSGAIATAWTGSPFTLSFNITTNSFLSPYRTALLDGIGGVRADVVNGSYGGGDPTQLGTDFFSISADAIARESRKTMVWSSGNSGSGAGSLNLPATGYNSLVVGATQGAGGNFASVAGFSSRGPASFQAPGGSVVSGVRARVDLVAPGTDLNLAFYGGATGGNAGGTGTADPTAYSGAAGTSFSAPIVAGGATLLCDVGRDRFAGNVDNALDGQVIKAVLLNSADKLDGWNNGQTTSGDGVVATTRALDFDMGAGQMNLDRAFDQYTVGTTDLPGLGGGSASAIGWDFGEAAFGSTVDYILGGSLDGGSTFTATLNWYVNREINFNLSALSETSFTNLDLQLFLAVGGSPTTLVAESTTLYNNTEHFQIALPSTSQYVLRVRSTDMAFGSQVQQTFGLAWFGQASAVIPEPGALIFLGLGFCALGLRNRRRP